MRDPLKLAARSAANVAVKRGILPHPNSRPCVDCGHIYAPGERRHENDHFKGYAPEFHLIVQPVCTRCHAARDGKKAKQTHCVRGHQFTAENTGRKPNGTRFCKECHRAFDRGRRDAQWWREYRKKRRERDGREQRDQLV